MRGKGLPRYIWVLANEPGGLPGVQYDFVSPSGLWAFKVIGVDIIGVAQRLRYLVVMVRSKQAGSRYLVTEKLAELLHLRTRAETIDEIDRLCFPLTIPALEEIISSSRTEEGTYRKEIARWLLQMLINDTKERVVSQRLLIRTTPTPDCRRY